MRRSHRPTLLILHDNESLLDRRSFVSSLIVQSDQDRRKSDHGETYLHGNRRF